MKRDNSRVTIITLSKILKNKLKSNTIENKNTNRSKMELKKLLYTIKKSFQLRNSLSNRLFK